MALYNESYAGRLQNLLRKFHSMKGPSPAPQVSSEITTTLSLFAGVELRALEGWERFAVAFTTPAQGIGNISTARFRNPAGSNTVAVLEKILYVNNGGPADNPTLAHGPTGLDLAVLILPLTAPRLDARTRANPSMVISTGTGAIGSAAVFSIQLTNTQYDYILFEDQEIPVLPGDAIEVRTSFTNSAGLQTSWHWRERGLEDSELKI